MKFLIKADLEIEVDDKWLQDCWEEESVEDEEADALKVAIGTFQDAVNPATLGRLFDAGSDTSERLVQGCRIAFRNSHLWRARSSVGRAAGF